MKLSFYLLSSILAAVTSVVAQPEPQMACGNVPSAETVLRMEADFAASKAVPSNVHAAASTIRVHFHVITKDGTVNVPDAQLVQQINVLNQDYSNAALKFQLAGIKRWQKPDWSDIDPQGAAQTQMKNTLREGGPADLNVYIVNSISSPYGPLLGYATFPFHYSGNPKDDGVVLDFHTLPALQGDPLTGYNLGRILTHEVGHWVGLLHTFQDGCNGGDQVADTPAEASPARGCPEGRNTCADPGNDPIHNFMDYTDNACMNHFTPGQAFRLRAQIAQYRGIA